MSPRWNFFQTRSNNSIGSLTAQPLASSDDLREAPLGAMEHQRAEQQSAECPCGRIRDVPRSPEDKMRNDAGRAHASRRHFIQQVLMADNAEAKSLQQRRDGID